jgi:hypothetical protein
LAPFEINYGRLPYLGSLVPITTPFKGVREYAEKARWNLIEAHDQLIASRVTQTTQANRSRRLGDHYKSGDLVYLSTKNLKMPKGRVKKLTPKYIGPFKISESNPESSTVLLDLPEDLRNRRLHPRFHTNLIRPHFPNDSELFPNRQIGQFYDLGKEPDAEYRVERITAHRWSGKQIEFYVQWELGDFTWEPKINVIDLEALQNYINLRGAKTINDLPVESSSFARK